MFKKILLSLSTFFICILFFMLISTYVFITNFSSGMIITYDEVDEINKNIFNKVELQSISNVFSANDVLDFEKGKVNIKFLNLFNVASFDAYIPQEDVIVCGNTVGVLMNTDGVTIVGFSGVNSKDGIIYPFKNCNLKVGDRIKSINDKIITNIDDIDNAINVQDYNGGAVNFVAIREEKQITGTVNPVYDISAKMYKLGLWIREDASGIGTLTFIKPNSNRFGALGHGICDNGCEEPLTIKSGTLHQCEVLGVNKGERGTTGEIRGLFVPGKNCEGVIDKNNEYGVYGYINEGSEYITAKTMKVGGRLSVKPGKAQILCCLDGKSVKSYDIEIIKTTNQNRSNPKSMVLRVVDKELLALTGGIIQGMSGSPIIQNNKLVGAVTHVFVNDPSKGFGVYLDWMINQ
ncbi:MAG: SpoIVB peptidase [Christensenellales bacterium]